MWILTDAVDASRRRTSAHFQLSARILHPPTNECFRRVVANIASARLRRKSLCIIFIMYIYIYICIVHIRTCLNTYTHLPDQSGCIGPAQAIFPKGSQAWEIEETLRLGGGLESSGVKLANTWMVHQMVRSLFVSADDPAVLACSFSNPRQPVGLFMQWLLRLRSFGDVKAGFMIVLGQQLACQGDHTRSCP